MRRAVDTALILAAGRGTRLGKLGTEIPKGFLELGDETIIEASIGKLSARGVKRIVIVTGHLARFYQELAARRPGLVETVHNPQYIELGSLRSLQVGLERVGPGRALLLLESDLVYEPRALDAVLADPREDVLLLSGPTRSGDEVWVETDGDGRLLRMSKDRGALGAGVAGELVGITRVSAALAALLAGLPPEGEYEVRGLVAASAARPVWCRVVEDLQWAEIDDERHLHRARGLARGQASRVSTRSDERAQSARQLRLDD